jgi:hypothetical protein
MNEEEKRLFAATATRESGAGFCATREGHLSYLEPLTPPAEAWLRANVSPEATWAGDTLVVEDRYFGDIVEAIIAAGFTFERNALPN